jgi:hypothetical protein
MFDLKSCPGNKHEGWCVSDSGGPEVRSVVNEHVRPCRKQSAHVGRCLSHFFLKLRHWSHEKRVRGYCWLALLFVALIARAGPRFPGRKNAWHHCRSMRPLRFLSDIAAKPAQSITTPPPCDFLRLAATPPLAISHVYSSSEITYTDQ